VTFVTNPKALATAAPFAETPQNTPAHRIHDNMQTQQEIRTVYLVNTEKMRIQTCKVSDWTVRNKTSTTYRFFNGMVLTTAPIEQMLIEHSRMHVAENLEVAKRFLLIVATFELHAAEHAVQEANTKIRRVIFMQENDITAFDD
jgi:hypothetical protein